jgi:hypothetical protein
LCSFSCYRIPSQSKPYHHILFSCRTLIQSNFAKMGHPRKSN